MASKYVIVVGVDFGPTGDSALAMAIELGREIPSAELHLVHVVIERNASPSAARLAVDERLFADAVDQLKAYATLHREEYSGAHFAREVVLHVRLGEPADSVHQVAVDADANLIIVGTHGTHGVAKLILGSVSERLVKIARLPVLVARPKDFSGLTKSLTKPEAARPGQTEEGLHAKPGFELRGSMEFGARASHVSGGI